jgi:hypothetical protein
MKLRLIWIPAISAFVVSSVLALATMAVKEIINCTVTNDSAFQNTYEIFDNVANTSKGTITLAAHGKTSITLKSSKALDDGYGSFKSKKSDSQVWNNFDLIRDGETRSLN